ncbi:MAG: signal peptidase II [Ilumatobacteraceae bacterium]
MTGANDSTERGDETDADVRTDSDSELDAAFCEPVTELDVDPDVASASSDESSHDSADDSSAHAVVVAPRPRSSIPFSLAVAAVVLVLDQLSKHWAVNALSDGASRHVVWKLNWNLAYNSGMAFSRGQGIGPYIGALALVVVVVLVLSLRRQTGRASTIAVGLVVGGACGNLADRLFRGDGWLHGSVIDFIDFQFWPIFNVADMGVSIGGVLIVLTALFEGKSVRASAKSLTKVGSSS